MSTAQSRSYAIFFIIIISITVIKLLSLVMLLYKCCWGIIMVRCIAKISYAYWKHSITRLVLLLLVSCFRQMKLLNREWRSLSVSLISGPVMLVSQTLWTKFKRSRMKT